MLCNTCQQLTADGMYSYYKVLVGLIWYHLSIMILAVDTVLTQYYVQAICN